MSNVARVVLLPADKDVRDATGSVAPVVPDLTPADTHAPWETVVRLARQLPEVEEGRYRNYPSVLIHRSRVPTGLLAEALEESWAMSAPQALVAAFEAERTQR